MSEDESTPRRHPRILAAVPVRVATIDPETDSRTGRRYFQSCEESCANLSRGGAFIHTSDDLKPGRRLLLELRLPSGERIETIGRVAWSKAVIIPQGRSEDSGVGVEFLGGTPDQFSALEEFIDAASKPGSDDAAE